MRTRVRLRDPDGRLVELGHGDAVGRLWNSALCLDDPRVSEAHALVSLRGHELKLLALRGRFAVDGRPVAEVALRAGQTIALAAGVELHVEEVEVPDAVLGLTTDGFPPRALPGTCGLAVAPAPAFVPPAHPDALGHAWSQPDGWRARVGLGQVLRLDPGTTFELGGLRWTAVPIRVDGAVRSTSLDGALDAPLRLVARYDTVHVFREGAPPALLQGLPARLVTELVAFGGPVAWTMLAAELWPHGGSRKQLDMVLVRLRRLLRDQRVRADLVRADGTGMIELVLHPGDEVEDQA